MGSEQSSTKMVEWNNSLLVVSHLLMLGFIPLVITVGYVSAGLTTLFFTIPLSLIILWLCSELIYHSFISIRLQNGQIQVSKPLRRYSLLTKKRHHHFYLDASEWDELAYYKFRYSTTICFRMEGKPVGAMKMDGISFLIEDLGRCFPEKRISQCDEPADCQINAVLKKEYPERVL